MSEIINLEFLLIFVGAIICSSFTETTVEVKIPDGTGVIKVGIGKYVLPVGQTLHLSCKTRQFVGAQLWILRDDEVIHQSTFDGTGITTVSIDIVGEEHTAGMYTCRFYRMVKRRESETIYFTTENSIELKVLTQDNLPLCFSSLGVSGLPEEETTVFCGTYSTRPPQEEILWRGLSTKSENFGSYKFYFADIQLNNPPSDISCGYFELGTDRHEWTSFCSVPPVTILEHTQLTLEPSEFNELNETLQFTCASSPPASLIRWNIFGHRDNIIDDYYTTKVNGEIRVNITQRFGQSILTIPSSSIRIDGVHIVACSTKRQNFQMAVSEYTLAPALDTEPTSLPSTLKQGPGTDLTVPSISSRYSSNSSGHSNFGFVIIIVLLVIIVLMLGVVSSWLYRKHLTNLKHNNRPASSAQVNADGLSIAQRSATYQPLNSQVIAPPAYTDLDVGYATMSTPQLDERHYMEPSVAMKGVQM